MLLCIRVAVRGAFSALALTGDGEPYFGDDEIAVVIDLRGGSDLMRSRRTPGSLVAIPDVLTMLLEKALRFFRQRLGFLDTLPKRRLGLLDLPKRFVRFIRHVEIPPPRERECARSRLNFR